MTIGNIYIEFDKITTLGRPWGVIGGPWDSLEESFGTLGASWELIGAPRGLLGALLKPTTKMTKNSNVGRFHSDGKTNRISTFS